MKENLHKERLMDMVASIIKRVENMKDFEKMINSMVWEGNNGLTEHHTKDNIKWAKNQVREHINGLTTQYIKGNGIRMRSMGMGYSHILIRNNT